MRRRDSETIAVVCPSCGYAALGFRGMTCPDCESEMVADSDAAGPSEHEALAEDNPHDFHLPSDDFVAEGDYSSLEEEREKEIGTSDSYDDYE